MKVITPFVGSQVDICKAFGFAIPDGCAPVYVSKAKSTTRKRGRPTKPKVEKQEFQVYEIEKLRIERDYGVFAVTSLLYRKVR